MPDKPVMHGYDHRPGGFDAIPTGAWIHVTTGTSNWSGSTTYSSGNLVNDGLYQYKCILTNKNIEPGVNAHWAWYWVINQPLFQNGWDNQGGSLQAMRFRISIGYPNFLSKDDQAITTYTDHQVELQGSVAGGSYISIVFYLPPAYWPENNVRLPASDDLGGFIPFTVKSDGSVWRGVA